jgi:sugar O-acyltransferase (sialic acid O-acetyltransferase NeuD family)
MIELMIVGAGGHARVVLAALPPETAVAILDRADRVGADMDGVSVIGDDDLLMSRSEPAHVAIGDNARRRAIVARAGPRAWATIVSPDALLIGEPEVGDGAFIGARAVVQASARIGRHAIVNTGAIVEHDCIVGDFAHVGPGAILCGAASIQEGALVGAGAVVIPGIVIGRDAVVGAGAVVVRSVPDGVTVVGNPARPLEH